MKTFLGFCFIFYFLITPAVFSQDNINLETTSFKIGIDGKGYVTSFGDKVNQTEYMPAMKSAPLMALYKDSVYFKPSSAKYNESQKTITLNYSNGSVAVVQVENKKDYIRLELVSLEPRNGIQAIVWGPYPTTINEKIGETVCVVRNQKFAIGMQALDLNTIEGLPDGDDDAGGGYVIDPLPGQQLPDSLKSKIGTKLTINVNKAGDIPPYVRLYRGNAAVKTVEGSELRLFSRDRRIPRTMKREENGKFYFQQVEPIDVDFTGSSVAIFGCPEPQTLDVIGKIELNEDLPHPMLNGIWVKKSKIPGEPYLLNTENTEQSIKYAKECGFKLINIGDVFKSWGHFGLETKRFADGAKDISEATALAAKNDIGLGFHTLSMFTSKNDNYVTPVPSDSLCKIGSSVLTKNIGAEDQVIYVEDTTWFKYPGITRTVKIGKELINYRIVSTDKPWRLLDCQRGQLGTTAAPHSTGSSVDKLANNMYKGFYPDIHLQDNYSKRLATVCNETGASLMDFDGFNGSSPTGHGEYACARFINLWYKSLDKYVLNSAAGPFHYYWHIYSFMNWGEPWRDALRVCQVNYRIENQRYFDRNLMPGMLGWFTLNPDYRPEDIEWIQARSAGFDAGYLLRVNNTIEKSGFKNQLFEAIREWQKARKLHVFSAEQKERLKDPKNEFHLEKTGENSWDLFPVFLSPNFLHKYQEIQTGEPNETDLKFDNPFKAQKLQFYIIVFSSENRNTATVSNIQFSINNYQTFTIQASLKAGDHMICNGQKLYLCDENWNKLNEIATGQIPVLEKGTNEIAITSEFSGKQSPVLSIQFKSVGPAERIAVK